MIPVDGFTVARQGDKVVLILSNRYGQGDHYAFDPRDAQLIGAALIAYSEDVWEIKDES